MRNTLRSVASLLLSYGLLLLANGLFGTLLGVRTKLEGFSTEVIGVIMAGYFFGILLGAIFGVRVVVAVGHIRAFAAFASLMSVTALVHVLLIDPLAWGLMRVVSGFCMAGMIMVTESWLNERATNETRGRVLSFYMITNFAAAGCGQFLLPLADPGQFQLFSVASIIFSLAVVPVLMTRSKAPLPLEPQPLQLPELYRVSPLGFVGACGAGLVNSSLYGLGPVFAQGLGLTLAGTSTFMASVILGGLVLQWPVGRLSDYIDRRWVLAGIAIATSASCLGIVAISEGDHSGLYLAGAIYGGLAFTVYSVSVAHANDYARPDQLVQTASGLLIAYGVGATIGPILAATLMGRLGPSGLFLFSAAVTAFLGLFAFYRMTRRPAKARDEQGPYVALPGAQFSSEELYATTIKQMSEEQSAPPQNEDR